MLVVINETDIPDINTDTIKKIVDFLTNKDVECVFVDNKEMQELNLKERNLDKTTDVLSFPLDDIPFAPLGSIVINIELALSTSKKLNHALDDEIALLFIHGMLHLLGFDHESDEGQMGEKEKELINKFNLPASLIDRALK